MSKVTILADSTCDLTPEILDRYQIKVIPLYVIFNNEKFKDRININTEQLYDQVSKRGILPKTSPPSISNFIEIFYSILQEGNDVVYKAFLLNCH